MNLQTTFDIDLRGFFQWWARELAFLIPKKIRQLLSDRAASLIFTADESGFNVCFYRDATANEPVLNHHLDRSNREAFQNLKNRHDDLEKADYILRLTDAQAIAKVLFLPEAALENLQQVVGFELDRYTPFKAEQAYFTVVPLGKTGHGQVKVLLVLTPQTQLDEQLALLNAWGVQPGRIDYRQLNEAYPQLDGQYNLLPEHYRPESSKLARSINWLLNGVLFMLLLGVLVYPVWQEKQTVDLLKSQIKALEKETRVVDAQQLEIDALREETQRLISIKNETPELVAVLTELTHLLKDDTWLTNLQYSEKHMQIQGQSPMASSLIGLLEESPFFSKVSFVSPLTQDKTTGMERFQISMDVSAKPPETVQSESGQEPGATELQEPTAAAEKNQ